MKKVFLVVALVLYLVGSVSAQVQDNCRAGTLLSDCLIIVTARGHIDGPKFDLGVKIEGLKLEFDVPIDKSDTTLVLAKRVLPLGYVPYFDPADGSLRIRRIENSPVRPSEQVPDARVAPSDAEKISRETINSMLGPGAYERAVALNNPPPAPPASAVVQTIPVERYVDSATISRETINSMLGPGAYERAVMTGSMPYPWMSYTSETWHGLPFYDLYYKDAARRQESVWSTGLVKFKGRKRGRDEKFLEKVSVVACLDPACPIDQQVNIIDAAEGNNKWDDDVEVPINPDNSVTLLFVYEDGGDVVKAFSRRVWLRPMAVRSKPISIIVQQEQLDRARIRYNLKTHLLVENDEGDIDEK